MAFYRIYRPQTVEELDLTTAREALRGILDSGKFSHAYLFSGSKGTGKTSSARILAKILNCTKNMEALRQKQGVKLEEPCGECDSCVKIQRGASFNVIEIDAASNRRIDDVRAIQERLAVAPAEGLYVVYIIDEVHMLTTEAFNALLKTLEEPPKHVIFVLCTTEAHRLPDTIVSRCTRVLFERAGVDAVVRSLKKAVAGEKLSLGEGVIEAVAARVDGSFRDGMKILEQLSQQGRTITKADVDALTGFSDEYETKSYIEALFQKDVRGALQILEQKAKLGVDFGVFAKRCLDELHEQLLKAAFSQSTLTPQIRLLLQGLMKASLQIKGALVPQLPLELLAVEWCLEESSPQEKKTSSSVPFVTHDTPIKASPDAGGKTVAPKAVSGLVVSVVTPVLSDVAKDGVNAIMGKWPQVLKAVSTVNHSLAAFLRSARPVGYEGERLTVEVFYAFHKQQLEQPKHRQILEQTIGQLFGVANLQLNFILGQSKGRRSTYNASQEHVPSVESTAATNELVKAAEDAFV